MCQISRELAPTFIDDLSESRFLEGWTAIVGETPSIMLDKYHEMILVLVDTVPTDPDDRHIVTGPSRNPAGFLDTKILGLGSRPGPG